MADTDLSIINSALAKIGVDFIGARADQSKAAIWANEQYDKKRKYLLRAHPWNFALDRSSLAALVTTPVFEFDLEYQIPINSLRILKIDDENVQALRGKFKIEGRKILTNLAAPLNIQFISNITDTTLFDANFDEALACLLAAELAYPLVQSASLTTAMYKMYELSLRETRSYDAQEGSADDLGADIWLDARKF